jgi:ABC-type phosphate transport system substrate-binding protein
VIVEPPRRRTRSRLPRRRRRVGALGLAAALALALLPAAPRIASAADFVVVVNAANPETALPAAEISKLFLQRKTQWTRLPERVMAVDLAEDSPVRASFSRAIHQRPTAAVKAYWQKMIFSGRDVPPPEKASPTEVLAYVRANPGGIGYVPAGTALPDGVKALKVTQ